MPEDPDRFMIGDGHTCSLPLRGKIGPWNHGSADCLNRSRSPGRSSNRRGITPEDYEEESVPEIEIEQLVSSLPKRIARIGELAYNLWWTWSPEAPKLFRRIHPVLWETV